MGRADDLQHCLGVGADRRRGRRGHLSRTRKREIREDRFVTAEEIITREPDIIIGSWCGKIGSWCGKKFRAAKVAARPGFERIPAVRNDALHEIKSPIILQPGPAELTAGLAELQRVVEMATRG
jgi:iron complex transport system substrate-binding protein